ncbi:MAG: outer membrane lipoprotein-sorting protein [Ectothiorhodospiraceae bacterium]|nr:outer membrane lipoprotein-sorting protein [Ectothiorhodospiraceae bacterium]
MHNFFKPTQYIAVLLFSCLPFYAVAETAEEKGLAITIEADKRDTGWQDQTASLEMTLRNRHGQESKRKIRSKTLEVSGDGDKSMSIFDTPRDIKGTAFLSYTHALKADEQWLYLPALKRVKRISSNNKSGPFMGSEFSYEDLSSQEVEKYTYKLLREEIIDGRECFVIQRTPAYKHSGYTKLVTWLDKSMYQPIKIEFYDRKKALLKTLTYSGYQQYEGQFWRADSMHITNHLTKKSTDLVWTDYAFKTGMKARDFDRNSLKRAR